MKTTNAIRGTNSNAVNEDTRITAIKFMWMPGIKPVIVPAKRPKQTANNISGIMHYFKKDEYFINFDFYKLLMKGKRGDFISVLLILTVLLAVVVVAQTDEVNEDTEDSSENLPEPNTPGEFEDEGGLGDRAEDFEEEGEFDVDEEESQLRDGGLAPDSPFYFADEFFDNFANEGDVSEEKAAEIRAMLEQGKIEEAREAYERYVKHAEKFEEKVSPDEREETLRRASAIRKALREYEPEHDFVGDVLEQEERVVTASEIAFKIKELCVTLSKLDPEEFYSVCRTEKDSPKWQRDLFEDLSKEQEKEAREFFDILSQCMRTEGRECDCERIPHDGFANMCSIVAPLATACSEGNEDACDKMDEKTEDMFEILKDAPHLQRILEELEDGFEDERYEHYGGPRECEGITDRAECEAKIFRSRAPDECQGLADRFSRNYGIGEAREDCEDIMFEAHAPEECVNEGIRDPKECGKLMFKLNAPEECIEAGLTGESRNDERKCREIMENFRGEDSDGGERHRSFASNCRSIDNSEKRLECYDGAAGGAREEYEERRRERQEFESEHEEDFNEDEFEEEGEFENEFDEEGDFGGEENEFGDGGDGENNFAEEGQGEFNEEDSEQDEVSGGTFTGSVIGKSNRFLEYYYKLFRR